MWGYVVEILGNRTLGHSVITGSMKLSRYRSAKYLACLNDVAPATNGLTAVCRIRSAHLSHLILSLLVACVDIATRWAETVRGPL